MYKFYSLTIEFSIFQFRRNMYTKMMPILRKPLTHYLMFTGLYFLLAIFMPPVNETMVAYHLNPLQYHVLLFVVILPIIPIWFAAFYGYDKLRAYADSIKKTAEGEDFAQLAAGAGWLAYSLPIPAIISIILKTSANYHAGFHPAAIIISNYLNLLLPLIAFSILSNSARALTTHANMRIAIGQAKGMIIAFVTLGVLFCYFTFRHFNLISLNSVDNAYYLPVWLAVMSIIIPYLYAWFIGLLAAYEITLFAKQTRGLIYRQALSYLGYGVAAVIISSIALQYLLSLAPKNSSLSLNYLLAGVYIIQIIAALGYSLIAFGATRLKKIEEV